MLTDAANKIVQMLLSQQIIEDEQKNLYQYGFELLISSLLSAVWIVILGVALNRFSVAVIYILILMTVRTQIGGFHADSYKSCFLYYNLFFGVALIFTEVCMKFRPDGWIVSFLLCLMFLLEYFLAPVPHRKQLNIQEKELARSKGILRTAGWCVLLGFFWKWNREWSYEISIVLLISTVLMAAEYVLQNVCSGKFT